MNHESLNQIRVGIVYRRFSNTDEILGELVSKMIMKSIILCNIKIDSKTNLNQVNISIDYACTAIDAENIILSIELNAQPVRISMLVSPRTI